MLLYFTLFYHHHHHHCELHDITIKVGGINHHMGGLPSLCSHHYYHYNHNHYHLIQYYPRSLSYNNIELHDITIPGATAKPARSPVREATGEGPEIQRAKWVPPIWVSGSYTFYIFLPSYTMLYPEKWCEIGWMVIYVMGIFDFFGQQNGDFLPYQNGGCYPLLSSLQDRDEAPGVPEELQCLRRWLQRRSAAIFPWENAMIFPLKHIISSF